MLVLKKGWCHMPGKINVNIAEVDKIFSDLAKKTEKEAKDVMSKGEFKEAVEKVAKLPVTEIPAENVRAAFAPLDTPILNRHWPL